MKRPGVRRLFSISLGRRRWADEVEEEIITHLAIRAERLVALGMTPQAAKEEAIRRFGPLDASRAAMIEAATHREEYMRRRETFAELKQDLAFTGRTLARNKGWATVAVVTLALGIGATTAVWSAASTLLLHPLPYPHPSRIALVNLMPTTGNSTGINIAISAETRLIRAWRQGNRSFESLEPFSETDRQVGVGADTTSIASTRVLASFADFAGVKPVRGRNFTAAEVAAKEPVVLVSEAFWQARLGGDPDVMGRTISISGRPHRIIGVMPNSLQAPSIGSDPSQLWLPLDLSDDKQGYRLVGRLREGTSTEAAARDLDSVSVRSGVYQTVGPIPFAAAVTPPGRTVSFHDSLTMLAAAVMLVLLVAAANVANLLLARSVGRQREIAVRTALGASRSRLTRQLMTETVTLAVLGCAAGAALGYVGLRAIVAFRPRSLSELELARIDMPTLAIIIGAGLLCGVLFGLIAAASHSRREVGASLRAGGVSSFSRRGERFRSLLVVGEMALSAMLLVGATLLTRTVIEMQRSDLGFDPVALYGLEVQLSESMKDQAKWPMMVDLAARLRAMPGVRAVTISDLLPSSRNFTVGALQIEGEPNPPAGTTSFVDVGHIKPDYFRVIGARFVEGRTIQDTLPSSGEVVINEGFARRHWKPGEAVGKRLRVAYGPGGQWLTIVGVVHDVTTGGPTTDKSAPFLYTALPPSYSPGVSVMLRTDGRPATLAAVLAAARQQTGTNHIYERSTERILASALGGPRFIMMLMAIFSTLALILAAVGLYGMMAYSVAQRTREIGIRIALGATRGAIGRSIVGRGAMLGVIGAVAGLTLAFWATRLIEGSLFGVSRLDTASFTVAGIGLVLIAIAACLVPTMRAVRVDPMTSIRAD